MDTTRAYSSLGEVSAWTPAKVSLKTLLARQAPALGLTKSAVDALTERSRVTYWRAGQRLCGSEEQGDFVSFLIAGVVKIVCRRVGGRDVILQMVGPGEFFCLPPSPDADRCRTIAVVHVDASVALMSYELVRNVVGDLPRGCALLLMLFGWRSVSRLAQEKCLLVGAPLRTRLLSELKVLAARFGRQVEGGVLIDIPLFHRDLAQLVGASRAKVTGCMSALKLDGLVDSHERRVLLVGAAVPPRAR